MRISDWSPDVCSSDLLPLTPAASPLGEVLRAAIVAIPHGETASYGQVARAVESGPRAVGQACARNPFPIIVPCHRVLGNGGSLRSEERRVGKGWVSTCRSRGSPDH